MKTLLFVVMFLILSTSPLFAGEAKEADFIRQGTAYLEAQDFQRAVKAFSRAAQLNPESADAHRGMGMAFLKLGYSDTATNVEMVDKAIAALSEVLRIAPDSAEVRYQLGLAYLVLDDKASAIKEYEALRGLDAGLAGQLLSRVVAYRPPKSFRTLVTQGGGSEGKSTRVTIAGNHVLVPVTLHHAGRTVQATLLLDTGASCTLIKKETADRLELDLDRAEKIKMQVADGRAVQVWHMKVDRITVGSQSKTGLDVAIVVESGGRFPFDGLLGMDFLRSFKHSIDFGNQVINWAQ